MWISVEVPDEAGKQVEECADWLNSSAELVASRCGPVLAIMTGIGPGWRLGVRLLGMRIEEK